MGLKSRSAYLVVLLALLAAACSSEGGGGGGGSSGEGGKVTARVQLSWIPDCQFAGYLMADKKGYYSEEGLDVKLLPGGPNVNPQQQVATGSADMTIAKVAALYAARAQGLPMKGIAQFDQRSSFPLVAFKESGVRSPTDLKQKRVGIWYDGDEYEVLAMLAKFGLDPKKDVTLFEQGFTMDPFLDHQYPVAMVTTFNELNVLYLSGVTEDQLTVLNPSDYGITIPHGALLASEQWLAGNHKAAVSFVRATLKGWNYAFANVAETAAVCAASSKAAGGEAATGELEKLQEMMVKSIQPLQLPEGFAKEDQGKIDVGLYENVAQIVYRFGLVKEPVDVAASFDATVWQEATT